MHTSFYLCIVLSDIIYKIVIVKELPLSENILTVDYMEQRGIRDLMYEVTCYVL